MYKPGINGSALGLFLLKVTIAKIKHKYWPMKMTDDILNADLQHNRFLNKDYLYCLLIIITINL